MQMSKLVLCKYNRFRLNPIDEFDITITSPIQVILGTNGSGKSSVASEWSLLPGNPSDFKKDGSKIAEGSHNGSEYRSESHFGTSARFSFYKDGVALVEMGTATAVYECCRAELGLTREVLDLLQGRTRFTAMAPGKRKDWLMRLSNLDLTFIMDFYEQTKIALRDTVGAIKHVGKRLADETSKLEALVVEDEADVRIKQITDELSLLLVGRSPENNSYTAVNKSLGTVIAETTELGCKLLELNVDWGLLWDQGITETEDLKEIISDHNSTLKALQGTMAGVSEELATLYKNVELLTQNGNASLTDINTRLEQLQAQQMALMSGIKAYDQVDNPVLALDLTTGHMDYIVATVSTLPLYTPAMSPSARSALSDEVAACTAEIQKIKVQIERITSRVETLKELHAVECPNCHHDFKPGQRDGEDIGGLMGQIENRNKHLAQVLIPRSIELALKQQALVDYDAQLLRVKSMINDLPELTAFWRPCIQNDFFYKTPNNIGVKLNEWLSDLELHVKANALNKDIAELQETRSQLERMDHTDVEYQSQRILFLESTMTEQLSRYNQLNKVNSNLKTAYDNIVTIERLDGQLQQRLQQIATYTDLAIRTLRDQYIDDLVQQHHVSVASLRSQITARDSLLDIVGNLQSQFDELQLQQRGLKVLVEATSPTSGLIAEQLMGFIHCFVDQMNGIIGEFWNYDIKLLPGISKNGDLDYYFPFAVENEPIPTSDISNGSEAQVDLFDFAFRIVATGYLNLIDYPLYADELGRTFDEQHRHNLIGYIKRLMDARQFSQLLMISHYAANHSAMQGAEVCVIDSQNVMVHPHYNKHIKIS